MGDKTRGLYDKFFVERTDGTSAIGEKHEGCDYFVLDLTHDKHAPAAIKAYAESCRQEYPLLAADLDAKFPGAPPLAVGVGRGDGEAGGRDARIWHARDTKLSR